MLIWVTYRAKKPKHATLALNTLTFPIKILHEIAFFFFKHELTMAIRADIGNADNQIPKTNSTSSETIRHSKPPSSVNQPWNAINTIECNVTSLRNVVQEFMSQICLSSEHVHTYLKEKMGEGGDCNFWQNTTFLQFISITRRVLFSFVLTLQEGSTDGWRGCLATPALRNLRFRMG